MNKTKKQIINVYWNLLFQDRDSIKSHPRHSQPIPHFLKFLAIDGVSISGVPRIIFYAFCLPSHAFSLCNWWQGAEPYQDFFFRSFPGSVNRRGIFMRWREKPEMMYCTEAPSRGRYKIPHPIVATAETRSLPSWCWLITPASHRTLLATRCVGGPYTSLWFLMTNFSSFFGRSIVGGNSFHNHLRIEK